MSSRNPEYWLEKLSPRKTGYPLATIAFYGEDDQVASKVVVGIVSSEKDNDMVDRIIGCPHEEGIDYPEGEKCPQCPFWVNRDRWTGEIINGKGLDWSGLVTLAVGQF